MANQNDHALRKVFVSELRLVSCIFETLKQVQAATKNGHEYIYEPRNTIILTKTKAHMLGCNLINAMDAQYPVFYIIFLVEKRKIDLTKLFNFLIQSLTLCHELQLGQ